MQPKSSSVYLSDNTLNNKRLEDIVRSIVMNYSNRIFTIVYKLDIYKPIPLCNCIYKIIAKVIVMRVERLLSKSISNE
jgi:hypothetical protein